MKALERENLRDHMTDIELILTMLAEATTTTLHRDRESQGMQPLKRDAKDGGAVAGRTRNDIERQTGKTVISRENFKQLGRRPAKKLMAKRTDRERWRRGISECFRAAAATRTVQSRATSATVATVPFGENA